MRLILITIAALSLSSCGIKTYPFKKHHDDPPPPVVPLIPIAVERVPA